MADYGLSFTFASDFGGVNFGVLNDAEGKGNFASVSYTPNGNADTPFADAVTYYQNQSTIDSAQNSVQQPIVLAAASDNLISDNSSLNTTEIAAKVKAYRENTPVSYIEDSSNESPTSLFNVYSEQEFFGLTDDKFQDLFDSDGATYSISSSGISHTLGQGAVLLGFNNFGFSEAQNEALFNNVTEDGRLLNPFTYENLNGIINDENGNKITYVDGHPANGSYELNKLGIFEKSETSGSWSYINGKPADGLVGNVDGKLSYGPYNDAILFENGQKNLPKLSNSNQQINPAPVVPIENSNSLFNVYTTLEYKPYKEVNSYVKAPYVFNYDVYNQIGKGKDAKYVIQPDGKISTLGQGFDILGFDNFSFSKEQNNALFNNVTEDGRLLNPFTYENLNGVVRDKNDNKVVYIDGLKANGTYTLNNLGVWVQVETSEGLTYIDGKPVNGLVDEEGGKLIYGTSPYAIHYENGKTEGSLFNTYSSIEVKGDKSSSYYKTPIDINFDEAVWVIDDKTGKVETITRGSQRLGFDNIDFTDRQNEILFDNKSEDGSLLNPFTNESLNGIIRTDKGSRTIYVDGLPANGSYTINDLGVWEKSENPKASTYINGEHADGLVAEVDGKLAYGPYMDAIVYDNGKKTDLSFLDNEDSILNDKDGNFKITESLLVTNAKLPEQTVETNQSTFEYVWNGAGETLSNGWDWASQGASTLWNGVKTGASALWGTATTVGNWIIDGASTAYNWITGG